MGLQGAGTLALTSPAATMIVRGRLGFGPHAVFETDPGVAIHMTGAIFENQSTQPENLAGLSNLQLIFEGGPAALDTFEVAGRDMGGLSAGLENNFALGKLILGWLEVGRVQLVDEFDNQPTWQGAEALYVEHLILGEGSYLDLNGLALYVTRFEDLGGALVGGEIRSTASGDADLNGVVDDGDMSLLLANWGQAAEWSGGNFNGDGVVNDADLSLLLANWGPVGGSGAVPEPASAFVLLLGFAGAALRRGRK